MKVIIGVLLLAVIGNTNVKAEKDSTWKAGIAAEVITPEKEIWMAGYAARRAPSQSVLQDLKAKSLALEDGAGNRMIIVTLDLIGVPRNLRDEIEADVAQKHGLAAGQILLNASHTHSGPVLDVFRPNGGKDKPMVPYDKIPADDQAQQVEIVLSYRKFLRAKIGAVISQSINNLEPAVITMGKARCGFAMNRRTPVISPGKPTAFKNSPNPDGPVDHEVPVLQIRDQEKKLKGVLFGYACHATTLSSNEIHGDWPGFAQAYFEEDHPGAIAMFINGCSGDQNPYPRRMVPYVHRHGRSMASAVETALQTPQEPVTGALRSEIAWPEVDYSTAPTSEELVKRIETTSSYEKLYAEFLLSELKARGELPKSYPVPVQVVRMGNVLTLATIGGEVTIDYSLRLKRELAKKQAGTVWVAGYTNDVMTYIPSDRVLKEGGYEGRSSMIFRRVEIHPAPWATGIEETIVGEVHRLFDSLGEK